MHLGVRPVLGCQKEAASIVGQRQEEDPCFARRAGIDCPREGGSGRAEWTAGFPIVA